MTDEKTPKLPDGLRELESSTAVEAPAQTEPPHRIYVAYLLGQKGKPFARTLKTPFYDIETETQLQSVLNFLAQQHGETMITIINWKPLEG